MINKMNSKQQQQTDVLSYVERPSVPKNKINNDIAIIELFINNLFVFHSLIKGFSFDS